MKKLLLAAVLSTLLSPAVAGSPWAQNDKWTTPDKLLHAQFGALFGVGCRFGYRLDLAAAVACGMAVPLAKELYDGLSRTGNASWKDAGADLIGVLVGVSFSSGLLYVTRDRDPVTSEPTTWVKFGTSF